MATAEAAAEAGQQEIGVAAQNNEAEKAGKTGDH